MVIMICNVNMSCPVIGKTAIPQRLLHSSCLLPSTNITYTVDF